jgi:hypothetical protein
VLVRGLGFLFLGFAVGLSEGIAARSLGKLSYGTLGGTIGGFLGGSLFGLVYLVTLQGGGHASLAGALGFLIMGACIGSLSALVQGVFQPADEFASGCRYDWEDARDLLLRGDFARYFGGLGRADLARTAVPGQDAARAGRHPPARDSHPVGPAAA